MEFLRALGADMTLAQVLEMMLRVVIAAVCGGVVGIERSRRFKDAGVRTHCMVACASAVMMIISKYGFMDIIDGTRGADPSRVAAGIVTGVGFLGAGMIYRDRHQSLKGLTTAAGLWCVAGIGMAAGAGMYFLAVFSTVFIVLLQFVMHRFGIGRYRHYDSKLEVVMKDDPEALARLKKNLKNGDIEISDSSVSRKDGQLTCVMEVSTPSRKIQDDLSEIMAQDPEIYSLEFKDAV
ncbi:MAG: MgtC/SapB family protein [Firmicutes bacterium]|nr:MgtC/SapB family protein [Bacillota bacterium]